MLRIEDDKAAAARAAMTMAVTCLKAGRTEAAASAIETANDILTKDLEPSRANRGQPRPTPRVRVRTARTASAGAAARQ